MYFSRILHSIFWTLGICLIVSGAFGPSLGMDLGLAHYLLLAAILLYGFRRFLIWFNCDRFATDKDAIFIKRR